MKKKLISMAMVIAYSVTFGQIGIQTSNPQATFHVDGQKNNPASGVPSLLQQADDVVISNAGNIGVGTLFPITKLDTRRNPGNGTPGNGPIGIGETTLGAVVAGAGAVRYSTGSGGILQYSNGVNWNTLVSNVQKSVVIAAIDNVNINIPDESKTEIGGWTKAVDVNNNFNASTGVFTAPRNGNYQVSFSYTFDKGLYSAKSWVEAEIGISGGTRRVSSSSVPQAGGATPSDGIYAGANISFTVKLDAGQTIQPKIYQSSGSAKKLRALGTLNNTGFVNFSVVEL